MKKGAIASLGCLGISLIALVLLAIIGGIYAFNFNNKAVTLKEKSTKTWANVESAYQRRNDLIGNLVKTVQGAADFEKGTLTAVIDARAKATSVSIDPTNITPEQLAQFNKVQGGLSGALKSLLVTVERYPDLKANQNFLELQSQLEGTENRINVARDRFNATVEPYNVLIKKFPGSFFASLLNFDELAYFKSEAGSEKAPDVDFDFK